LNVAVNVLWFYKKSQGQSKDLTLKAKNKPAAFKAEASKANIKTKTNIAAV